MTKGQIDILINDGDIWPMNAIFKNGMTDHCFVNNADKEIYAISEKLYDFIEFILNFLLQSEVDDGRQLLLEELKAREKIYSSGTDLFKNIIGQMLQEQQKVYESLFHIPSGGYRLNQENEKLYIIIDDLLSDQNGGSEIIKFIKFEILHAKKIDEISIETIYEEYKIQYLQKYFYLPMQKIYEKSLAAENIKYLEKLVQENDIFKRENRKAEDLTHREMALICFFKQINALDIDVCRQVLKEYKSKLKKPVSIKDKYNEFVENGNFMEGSYKTKKTAEPMIESMKKILIYLTDDEQKAVNKRIQSISFNLSQEK